MRSEYDFSERLAFSQGAAKQTHPDTIRALIPGCVDVVKAPLELDKAGIDFIATLRRGSKLNIDIKARDRGCSRYWQPCEIFETAKEPELALEIWSVRPEPDRGRVGKVGWTLDESKQTDYTLHVFDAVDCKECFLIPFQLLRIAFTKMLPAWRESFSKPNGRDVQRSNRWSSECVFVPAWCVLDAVANEMRLIAPPALTGERVA